MTARFDSSRLPLLAFLVKLYGKFRDDFVVKSRNEKEECI